MASLAGGLGLPLPYAPLSDRAAQAAVAIDGSVRQVVLLVIDGLGDELLARIGPGSFLARHQITRLTSVFPSTTASAIPTFLTGLAPQQHGLTGWHMWFAEIDRVLAVLPLTPHDPLLPPDAPPRPVLDSAKLPAQLFDHAPLSCRLPTPCFAVSPNKIVGSPFNRFHSEGALTVPYADAAGMFSAIEGIVAGLHGATRAATQPGRPAFVHAYYPNLDSLLHVTGTRDEKVARHFAEFDRLLAASVERLADTGTLLVVTADHGFSDAPVDRLIELDRHPALAAMLARPLCGERRVAYAYVRDGMHPAFEDYVMHHLDQACWLMPTARFIAEGWFGPGEPHPRLASRAGDYVLLMKEDWTIKHWLPGERRYQQLGVHAGASSAEMRVPLVVFRP